VTTEDVYDLLDHAVEPDPWECDGDWEYRAMHWRPSSSAARPAEDEAGISTRGSRESGRP
jgi:hypothetical protein